MLEYTIQKYFIILNYFHNALYLALEKNKTFPTIKILVFYRCECTNDCSALENFVIKLIESSVKKQILSIKQKPNKFKWENIVIIIILLPFM